MITKKKINNVIDFKLEDVLIYKIFQKLSEETDNKIQAIWLVYEDTEEKYGSSSRIARDLKDRYKKKFNIIKIPIESSFDIQIAHDAIEKIFLEESKKFDLQEIHILCDSTGGTKPMSIGAALACTGQRKLVYCMNGFNKNYNFTRINKTVTEGTN